MALLIKVSNEMATVELGELENMQRMVGGYIEYVCFPSPVAVDGVDYEGMLVNEEGLLKDLPINTYVTIMLSKQFSGLKAPIVGDVVYLKPGEFQ
jgi:hypothetical protein